MYQFTTTTIINSSLDSNGTTAKFAGAATYLNVARVGKFLASNIVDMYKRPYVAGVKEVATVTVPALTANAAARLELDIRLEQSVNSEYASAYLYFKKPVVVEIIATGTPATDAAAFITQLNGLKDRFGHNYVTATLANTADIVVTAMDNNQRFYSVIVSMETANNNSIVQVDYITKATGTVTTAGKLGFGDDTYMIQSVMVPTAENVRYYGLGKDERPVLGGNYTQYTIRYSVAKDYEDGIVSGTNSITTHVFYVKSTLVTAFETELDKLSGKTYKLTATPPTITLDDGDGDTQQITVVNAIGKVTYASSDETKATVSATGLIDTVGAGSATITVTDSVGNTDTIAVTVQD